MLFQGTVKSRVINIIKHLIYLILLQPHESNTNCNTNQLINNEVGFAAVRPCRLNGEDTLAPLKRRPEPPIYIFKIFNQRGVVSTMYGTGTQNRVQPTLDIRCFSQ